MLPSLCRPVDGATSLITNRLPVLQRRPHDSAGGRDRAGGVLQGAGGHRLRQVPRRFHLLTVTPPQTPTPPPPPPPGAAKVRGQRRIRSCEVSLVPVAQGQYTITAAARRQRGAGPHNSSTSLRAQTLPSSAEGMSGDWTPQPYITTATPHPRSDPRRPSYSSAKRLNL